MMRSSSTISDFRLGHLTVHRTFPYRGAIKTADTLRIVRTYVSKPWNNQYSKFRIRSGVEATPATMLIGLCSVENIIPTTWPPANCDREWSSARTEHTKWNHVADVLMFDTIPSEHLHYSSTNKKCEHFLIKHTHTHTDQSTVEFSNLIGLERRKEGRKEAIHFL